MATGHNGFAGGVHGHRLAAACALWGAATLALSRPAFAGGVQTLDTVDVTDSADNLVGTADSSTEGTITPQQLEDRPILRTGELLEGVPGLLISQHSGEGKANQYYLRGINLDHGTDFATTVDGMPVNMPTHAHGQGYSDLNFVMPELLSGIQYRKGPYYADEGDFSAVGAAHLDYVSELKKSIGLLTIGTDSYQRAFAATSVDLFKGKLLLGGELLHDNGPWVSPDNFLKANAMVRYSHPLGPDGALTVDAMAYGGKWNATNQLANRAVDEGLVPRFGSLDPSDKGSSSRYSLSGQWTRTGQDSVTKVSAYVIVYSMDLYNDFTYFLNPGYGDQFHQRDRRIIEGGKASQTWIGTLLGRDIENTIGLQVRNDDIAPVALYSTDQTQYVRTVVQDDVRQTNLALYAENHFKWTDWLRTVVGLRGDLFNWNVNANLPQNSGSPTAGMVSPKGSVVFGPWAKTEFFINGGFGFHSNDVRAATETVDPQNNLPQTTVAALEQAKGAEVGVRSAIIPHLQNELTLWYLYLASEQIFDGDHGITSPSFASNRYGVESANYYTPLRWLTVDADLAYSEPHFIGDPAGSWIPGSPTWVVSGGVSVDDVKGFLFSLRGHYFGSRPQIDNDAVWSQPSTIINARAGYQFRAKPFENWRLWVDVFNVLDAKTADINYYYTSRLPGEPPAGVNDIHTHPADPIEVRVTLKGVL